jgi:hypothetical protein
MKLLQARQNQNLFSESTSQTAVTRFKQEKKMAVTMILITSSFLICWGPDIAQSIIQTWYWNFNVLSEFFETIFEGENSWYWGNIVSRILHHITILNSLCDPLIFFFRMKIIRESAFAIFKRAPNMATNSSTQMSSISVTTEVGPHENSKKNNS